MKNIPAGFHIHPNGGGLVSDKVSVSTDIFVGEMATICGGDIWGGTIRGGTIWGGDIRGGDIIESTPLFVQGAVHFAVNIKPGFIQIRCQEHSFADWKKHYRQIGKNAGYTPAQIEEYGRIIAFISANGRSA